ncbi:sulfotransferase family protein [Aquicoccus sp. SCR17]|nr:sulfotransferase family protein [Carideicomes alvinocaridis]
MSRLRVINLGLPKSGTTTFGRALKLSGLRIADHRIRPRQTDDTALHDRFVAELVYEDYFATGDPLARLEHFDGIAEISMLRRERSLWPQTDWGVIAAIRAHHPGARFVATRRPAEAMSASMDRWNDLGRERLPTLAVPGLPQGWGATLAERQRWIEAHHAHLRRLFAGAADFLELDVTAADAPDGLGAFLGRDIRWWGRANASRAAG